MIAMCIDGYLHTCAEVFRYTVEPADSGRRVFATFRSFKPKFAGIYSQVKQPGTQSCISQMHEYQMGEIMHK